MVQRYIEGGYGASEMEEDEHGDWVSYEDYAELKSVLVEVLDNIDPWWDLTGDTREKLIKLGLDK